MCSDLRSSMVTIISRQVTVFQFLLPIDLWLRSSLRAVKLYWQSQSHIFYLLQYLVSVKSSPRTSVSAGPRCTDGTNSPTLRISAPRSGRELRKLITMDQDQDTVCRQQMGSTPTMRCTGQCGHSLLVSFKSATLVHCNKYQQTFLGLPVYVGTWYV